MTKQASQTQKDDSHSASASVASAGSALPEAQRFKKGQRVFIINCTAGGTFFIEGEAIVVKPPKSDGEQAEVRFIKSGELYDRFIDPEAQADPFDFVSRLNLQVREAKAARS